MLKIFQQNSLDKNRFLEIDAIRGISALIILVHHYTKYIYSINQETSSFLDIIEYGKYTVHFFFVISGFLIFMTLDRSTHPKYFIVSRFSRLYPAYWVCLTITALVISLSPFYDYHPVTFIQFVANLTMFQHWFHIEDIDGIYWTLAVEMCFYILIFLVFIFGKQKNIERIGIVWLLVMIALHFLVIQNVLPSFNYFYYVPLLRNGDLFFAGILFYQLKNNPSDKRKHFLILLCLLTHFVINSAEESFAIAFIFTVLYLFVIDRLKFLRGKIPFFFGYICYPLYLLHQYIGYEIINSLNSYAIESTILKIILTGMIIIAIATCVTLLVERPAMKFLRKKLLPHK